AYSEIARCSRSAGLRPAAPSPASTRTGVLGASSNTGLAAAHRAAPLYLQRAMLIPKSRAAPGARVCDPQHLRQPARARAYWGLRRIRALLRLTEPLRYIYNAPCLFRNRALLPERGSATRSTFASQHAPEHKGR